MNNSIFHIKTGGTIAGVCPEYSEVQEMSKIFTDYTNFSKYIKHSLKIKNDYAEVDVCNKDSRQINESDREKIISLIEDKHKDGCQRFLITHGTYTMPETARYLEDHLSADTLTNSVIVLTGSMYPWILYGSDAPMNLGASLANLINYDKRGVYICMHGQLFEPKNVEKDKENLIFT